MKSISISPRENWQEEVEKLGFTFHTLDNLYWDESKTYEFSMSEVLEIEKATSTLHNMCLETVQYIIDNNLFSKFKFNDTTIQLIKKSWEEEHPSIYGRFDLVFNPDKDGLNRLKMLEYNSDTPTSLFEASVIQWYWLKEYEKHNNSSFDQFNSIHEKLIAKFKDIAPYLKGDRILYFSCLKDNIEDLTTVEYLRDCATQAGLQTSLIYIEDIGFDSETREYVDMDNARIENIFKLYPWEWLIDEKFSTGLTVDNEYNPYWIEPAWKMLMCNKLFLVYLYELFPNHPLLLRTYFDESYFVNNHLSYVKKPILGREGNNVSLHIYNGFGYDTSVENDGPYDQDGYIYQEYFDVPNMNNSYPVIGSWMIDQDPAGMGIRENDSRVTNNFSRFITHYIKD